ncbi:phospholipid carrier-dependent glycosyltransferase [Candidatus Microgenomates bacterium]|jgi:4-amino-4-deoxy-L-arabinose transferase-like glycosyltransferase|nr:MAG: phospholipid carrier-dependent glycosyltransferase [Candidatus Microgenomates bacterium]
MEKVFSELKRYWPIILIVLISLTLRLYRISSYMTFLGDEGRDALVWLRMVRNGKLTLIGPQTSIGNMYLGPLFYYLMLPFYFVLGTAGPSVGTALFGGATTFLLWYVGKNWFSFRVGLFAALLYALSPVAIVLSRSAWNPNIMPFFALLSAWGIWQFWQKENFQWLALEGIILSIIVQSHYLGLLIIPLVGVFFTIKFVSLIKNKDKNLKKYLLNFFLCVFVFVFLTFVPLLWFDLRHGFINYNSFYKFFSERQTTVNFKPYKAIPNFWPLWKMFVTRLLAAKDELVGLWLSIAIILGGIFIAAFNFKSELKRILKNKNLKPLPPGVAIILAWLGIGLLGMGLYKQHIYDHYFGFLFPALFLFTAALLSRVWKLQYPGKLLALVCFSIILLYSLKESPLKDEPGFQMQKTREISKKIIEESKGEPFNLGLIAKQNYDAGYRYFLEKEGRKAVEINALKPEETITKQLFVACEDEKCEPIGHPNAEIANFGWAKIEEEWTFPWGTKLFKLVHYEKQ